MVSSYLLLSGFETSMNGVGGLLWTSTLRWLKDCRILLFFIT